MTLKKISLKRLFTLPPDQFETYHNVLKHLQPRPFIEMNSLTDLSFGEVSGLKVLVQDTSIENLIEIFKMIFKIDENRIMHIDVVKFYETFNWIILEVKNIIQREVDNLTSEPNSKLRDAGIDQLNMFKELNTLIMLGEKFATPPQEVEKWNYSLVFGLMLHNKISTDINNRLAEQNKVKPND
jgi:hypothetical protein